MEVKSLGDVNHYLDLNIQINIDGSSEFNPKTKIEEMLKNFNLNQKKPT